MCWYLMYLFLEEFLQFRSSLYLAILSVSRLTSCAERGQLPGAPIRGTDGPMPADDAIVDCIV